MRALYGGVPVYSTIRHTLMEHLLRGGYCASLEVFSSDRD